MAGGFRNAIVAGFNLVRDAIQSPNFVAGVSGWIIRKDGTSEFADATIRGDLDVVGTNSSAIKINGGTGAFPIIDFLSPDGTNDAFLNLISTGGPSQAQLGINGGKFLGTDGRSRRPRIFMIDDQMEIGFIDSGPPSFQRDGAFSIWTENGLNIGWQDPALGEESELVFGQGTADFRDTLGGSPVLLRNNGNIVADGGNMDIGEAEATASVNPVLQPTFTLIPGTKITVTTQNPNAKIHITGAIDWQVTVAGVGLGLGVLLQDGVSLASAQIIMPDGVSRSTYSQSWGLTIATPGTHTFQLEVRKTVNAGTALTNVTHSKLSYVLLDNSP